MSGALTSKRIRIVRIDEESRENVQELWVESHIVEDVYAARCNVCRTTSRPLARVPQRSRYVQWLQTLESRPVHGLRSSILEKPSMYILYRSRQINPAFTMEDASQCFRICMSASRLLKHGRIAMTEVAAFPALDRAKKLFQQRKYATRRQEGGDHTDSTSIRLHEGSSSSGPERVQQRRQESGCAAESEVARRCTASLVAFCSDFDEQLRLVNSDLLLLNTSVRREYQRESLALEKLTSELLDGEVNEVKAPPTNHRVVKRCRVRLRARKPRIKLHVVLQSPQRTSTPKHPPTSPKILSRAALLAQQAVKACVLQSYTRLYLYRYLYRGGASQLVAAVKLASHCRLSRTFRHWRRVVTQRIKLRLRCHRAQQRIQRTATSIARSRAFEIVQTEGKYAMAKEFQQTKLLAQSFHSLLGWYQVLVPRSDCLTPPTAAVS